jgi:nitroimidazol reductase NimA-like FMN-containing flavoprotein (pyridoxamine 5'-phosphate oxidase superfamily)
VVLPTGYGREDDTLSLHGSSGNQALRAADGHEICVTVTHLDGLVCARSLFNHSINYRSAAIFGTARLISDDARKLAALRVVTEQLAPGQWDYARQPSRKELAATSVLELPLAEASVKVRTGGPHDDEEDYDLDVWAGVVPAQLVFGLAEPDPDRRADVNLPDHIKALTGHRRAS